MKSSRLILLAFAFAVIAAPALDAQEAAAPIRRSPPPAAEQATPTPAPVETPRPTATPEPTTAPEPTAPGETASVPEQTPAPTPGTEPAASPQPQASPERTRSAATTRRVRNEKPVRAVEPRERRPWDDNFGPGTPMRPTFDLSQRTKGSVASTLRALENRWAKAIRDRDEKTVAQLVADDFVGTSSTGKVGSKSTLVSAVRRDKNEYKSATARGMSVRSLGPDAAVVTGIASEAGTTPDGKRFKVSRRFTDTWRERNGKWQCVSSHATAIRKN